MLTGQKRIPRFSDWQLLGRVKLFSKDPESIEKNVWVNIRGCGDQGFIMKMKASGGRLQRE